MAGILYIVATPIGNLEDITFRANKTLKEVDVILAEDTRKTSIITRRFDIQRNILSYHQHSNESRKFEILQLLLTGKNLALVTDAGTPGISDPGNELIDYLLTAEPAIKVVPIPGASAITSALSVSGFNVNKFLFLGFLPKKKRSKLFEWIKVGKISFAFYDSPKRILKTLNELKDIFGDRRVYVGRELTKMYEDYYRGSFDEVIEMVGKGKQKGEVVVVLEATPSL